MTKAGRGATKGAERAVRAERDEAGQTSMTRTAIRRDKAGYDGVTRAGNRARAEQSGIKSRLKGGSFLTLV